MALSSHKSYLITFFTRWCSGTVTTLSLWMVMEIRWKLCISNGSDMKMVNLLPIYHISFIACSIILPSRVPQGITSVFPQLLIFCWFAYGCFVCCYKCCKRVFGKCAGAKVSGTVTSYASGLPCANGINVAPSGTTLILCYYYLLDIRY